MRRFVILEHCWNGVHFDFMVESEPGGPLRSWAIDANPTAGGDLPARALPDHRREYLTYEGAISGGRGSVSRWDEGGCSVVKWEPDCVRLVLEGRHITGPVELKLSDLTGGAEASASGMLSASGTGAGSTWVFRLGKLS